MTPFSPDLRGMTGAPRVLVVLAREPGGRSTGRKKVLATAVEGLRAAGANVRILALTHEFGPTEWLGCPVQRVAPPNLLQAAAAALGTFITQRSFNEALYDCRRVRRQTSAAARSWATDVVVADTVRAWGAATATGLPVIAHLDDLLSDRYAGLTENTSDFSVLGYYGASLSPRVRKLADGAAKHLLRIEAGRSRQREDAIAHTAVVTALTAAAEATTLTERTGVPITALPMAVEPIEAVSPATADPHRAVFLGGLDYGPNLEALRWWRDSIAPLLCRRGGPVQLSVIGFASKDHLHEFAGSGIDLLGYIPDLRAALAGHRMFVAPILSGAGVKTKVLDGMSAALPVVATTTGLSGIPAVSGVHALCADDAVAFADAVTQLAENHNRAEAIGQSGRALLAECFSNRKLATAWRDVLSTALGVPFPNPTRRQNVFEKFNRRPGKSAVVAELWARRG